MADVQAGTRIGPYRVESVLPGNRGGFAQVVKAYRVSGGSEYEAVAIKLARTDGGDAETYARALGSEVETLRVLKHPGIVRLFPIQLDDRRYSYMARAEKVSGAPWYFVMEYLTGGTAEDLVRRQGALPPALAVEIAHQVGVALDYIHTSGYAHLDLKPNNIVFRRPLTPDMPLEAVLVDFGAAQKVLRRGEVEAGALSYLSPERVQVLVGERAPETIVNKGAADVYGLGVTLYLMLTGDLPFKGKGDHLTTAILTQAPTRPMQVNRDLITVPDLDTLIMQMLEKDPQRRPGIKEVLTRLDQAVAPPRDEGAVHVEIANPATGRGWKYAVLALGALVVAEGFGLGFMWRAGSGAPTLVTPTIELVIPTAEATPTHSAVSATKTMRPTTTPVSPTPPPTAPPLTAPSVGGGSEPTIVPTFTPKPTNPPRPTAAPVSPPPPTPG